MFSPKMLMLSGMPALRNFDAIKASSGSRASGKAAHREEKSWFPTQPENQVSQAHQELAWLNAGGSRFLQGAQFLWCLCNLKTM